MIARPIINSEFKDNKVVTEHKISSSIVPDWLLQLPIGKWSIQQIEKRTNANRVNILVRMKVLRVDKDKMLFNKKLINIYDWKGAEFYLKRYVEERIGAAKEKQQQ